MVLLSAKFNLQPRVYNDTVERKTLQSYNK